jgi:Uma2 family endonuclease
MATVTARPEPLISGEQFAKMVDLGPCELVDGRIVRMTPPGFEHGEVESNGAALIREFVRANKLGRVAVGEVGIYVRRDPDVVRAADIAFISNERYARRDLALTFLDVAPELTVEVLSPSNTMAEMLQKLRDYFAIGVRLVWLVDPGARCVYAYRSLTDIRLFEHHDQLPGDDVLPGFAMPVSRFFE